MFSILYDDLLLLLLCNFTNINDVTNFASINNEIHLSVNNDMYINWGRNMYTKNFWNKAKKREPRNSKPLSNMRLELLRIDNFQKNNIRFGYEPWTNDDFFKYWESIDNFVVKKKLI